VTLTFSDRSRNRLERFRKKNDVHQGFFFNVPEFQSYTLKIEARAKRAVFRIRFFLEMRHKEQFSESDFLFANNFEVL
jgi:hypothetical protein